MKAHPIFFYIFLSLATCIFNSASGQNPDDKNWSDKFGYPGMMGLGYPEESNLAVTYRDTAYIAANYTEFGQETLSRIIKWDGNKYSNFIEGSKSPVFSRHHEDGIFSFAVDSTGHFFIGGIFDSVDGKHVGSIAMWDGSKWIDLKGGIKKGRIKCIEVYPEGVIVAGSFDSIGGVKANNIAKWDGSSWYPLDSGIVDPISTVYSIARHDSSIYAVASGILRSWNGSKWQKHLISRTSTKTDYATITSVVSIGKDLYICGQFDSINTLPMKCVAKKQDTSWIAVGNYTGKRASQVVCAGSIDGKLFIRGNLEFYQDDDTLTWMLLFDNGKWRPFAQYPFRPYGHITKRSKEIVIAQPNGYALVDPNLSFIPAGLQIVKNDTVVKSFAKSDQSGIRFGPINKIALANNEVYALGNMYLAGLQNADSLMSWDGTKWSKVNGLNEFLGSKRQNELKSIATAGDRLYVQGDFDVLKSDTTFGFIMHDNLGWHSMYESDFEIYDHPIMYDYSVNQNGDIAAYSNYGITLWKNNMWSKLALPYELNDTAQINVVALDGDTLYVNYYFNTIKDGISTFHSNEILKWDGSSWQQVRKYVPYIFMDIFDNISPGGGVNKMTVHNGIVYITGFFTHIDSIRSGSIAGFKDNNLITFGKGVDNTKPYNSYIGHEQIFDIAFHNNDIYVGGVFDRAGDSTAFSIAKWDGNSWYDLGSGVKNTQTAKDGVQLNGSVSSMCIFDNKLYIAGDFERAGGKNAQNISFYELPPLQSVRNTFSSTSLQLPKINPNPTSGIITVTLDEANNEEITVSDVLGRIVKRATAYSHEITLDCTELPKGTYYLSVSSDGSKAKTTKFVLF
jgi:hypothetical protein